jgi:exosome complex exonuclease DIS3/RRP44
LPPEDYKIELEDGRLDLRHLPVLSIDPPGCKDIDDALHCIVLPNGNYQAGVHIADVTHYVKAGTAIDLEAANRSTSTYLVNKRLDMLPGLLTTDLCSLKGNVDRFAFSVLWEVTPSADIVNVEFKKSIIHSIAALTYQQAQGMIDQKDSENDIQAGAVKRLASLARKFRKRRIDAGALTLASPEVKFVLDSESLNPTDVQAYQLFEANALVEEFMLLANVTVGKKILRHYPTLSVLRRHPAPNRAMFDGLISKAKCRGFSITIDDSKKLADSLDAAVSEEDPYFNKLLRILSTRCMSPAQYFCSGEYKPTDWHHYGLAAPVYTHFTSPIRRYADVCVHRLLAAAIGVDPLPVHLSSKSYLHDLAANMNRRHRAAQLAGRASVQLHTLIVFSGDNGEKEEDAYVLDVDTNESADPSFTVIVPRYGIEGRVQLKNIKANDEKIIRNTAQHSISYENVNIQVFDKVRVKIWVKEEQDDQKELMLDLVSPSFGSSPMKKRSKPSPSSSAKKRTPKRKKKKTTK